METRFSITVALVCRQIRTHWKLCIMYKVKNHTATNATTIPTGRIAGERKQHHNVYLSDTLIYNSMHKDSTTLSYIDLYSSEEGGKALCSRTFIAFLSQCLDLALC